ncbi:MAG: D-alanyl-D-alanine carboxypeptidase family protein [Nocardioidaceae bacterium]
MRSGLTAGVAAVVLTTVVMTTSGTGQASTPVATGTGLSTSAESTPVTTAAVQVAAATAQAGTLERIELQRHKGYVTGDGQTIYVANRTTFRPRRATVHLPPVLRGRSWVVVDLDDGRILGKHAPRRQLPQASTMKLLTAVTAIGTTTSPHKVTRFEARQTCSCAGLKRGYRYYRKTLLAGALLPSGNDAAEAVAGSYPEGRHAFYRAMNRHAVLLGATDTVARNASGLTAFGSHSSARDLVLLLRAALAEPAVAPYLSMPSATIASIHGRDRHRVWHGTDYVNKYPSAAGKSGYTTPAKNTLVVVTPIAGRRIAVASMGVPGGYSTSGARALTLWASRNYDGLRAVGTLPYS